MGVVVDDWRPAQSVLGVLVKTMMIRLGHVLYWAGCILVSLVIVVPLFLSSIVMQQQSDAMGTAHATDKRPLDEIVLKLALSSSSRPNPNDIVGAVHYAASTYPHGLTDDDAWAFNVNQQMLKTLPPVEYDHPFAGDLYVVESVEKCSPPDLHRIACAEPHDTWCVIRYEKEQATRWGWTVNLVMRHEIGHCNGWPGDHRGAKYSLPRDIR